MRYGDDRQVKLYYTISEVVDMTGVPAHILRYWEQEIPLLKPRKNRAGNRVFKEKEIELVRRIKYLLQVEKFTLQGSLKKLKENPEFEMPVEAIEPVELILDSSLNQGSIAIDDPAPETEKIDIPAPEMNVAPKENLETNEGNRPTEERKTTILRELQQIRELLK